MRGSFEPRDEFLEPCAALGERQRAQVFGAVDQKIVGADVGGKFEQQLRR